MQTQRLIIDMHHIKKTYLMGDMTVAAVKDVSMQISEGEFVAIMGTSGSGKSTMMNIIGCLDRPTSGTYVLSGRDVSRLEKSVLAEVRNKSLGFVFQQFNLLSRTSALENVELPLLYSDIPAAERHQRSHQALERVGLGDRVDHHPNQMSGGQQQRVAIARALVNNPPIILADEPTGALDTRTSFEVMVLFQELWRSGMTVLIVTHEPDIAKFASRVIVMKDGEVKSDQRQTPEDAKTFLAAEVAA